MAWQLLVVIKDLMLLVKFSMSIELNKEINTKQVIAVVLSFVNLVFSLLSFFVIYEYFKIITNGSTWRLEYHEVWFDILFMVVGITIFVYSLINIFRYFRHKKIKLLYPVLFIVFVFIVYFGFFIISFITLN